jgi:DNA end-binding protein Ku
MAIRSVWTGSITFLLVQITIKLYTAIESSQKISFNQLHAGSCLGPVGHKQQCKKCNSVVGKDELTKGYNYEDDKYVIVAPEDIAAITPESNRNIEILGFIDRNEIPLTFYDSPYLAAPDGAASGKPYALLKAVMQRTGKVAIGKIIMRDREDLVVISARDEGLLIQTLRYPREIRSFAAVPGLQEQPDPSDQELELATALVARMETTFDQIDTVDHYYEALRTMLDNRIAGKEIQTVTPAAKTTKVVDIMDALWASLKLNATEAEARPAESAATETQQPAAQPQLTLVSPAKETQKTRKRRAA